MLDYTFVVDFSKKNKSMFLSLTVKIKIHFIVLYIRAHHMGNKNTCTSGQVIRT